MRAYQSGCTSTKIEDEEEEESLNVTKTMIMIIRHTHLNWIDANALNVDKDLAGGWRWARHGLKLEHRRAAKLLHNNSLHGGPCRKRGEG